MFTLTVLEALAAAGVPAYLDEEGFVVAHPVDVPRDSALKGEHLLLCGVDGRPFGDTDLGHRVTAWRPDPVWDFDEIDTVCEALRRDADQCARTAAEWFSTPRPSAGAVLRTALTTRGITAHSDHLGMSYAIPLNPTTATADIYTGPHLSIGDRNPSVDHMPSAHTGWTVFEHDANGEPIGAPLFISGDGGPVDCTADSTAAAEAIADFLTRSAR